MQKGAEPLSDNAKRTGGRVVDCSGLENLAGNEPETAETSGFCGLQDAQPAMFAPRSDARDGALVGTEEWRPIPGCPGYQVSDYGRIRRGERLLKVNWAGTLGKQYLRCCVNRNGQRKDALVHCLVAEAFIGPKPQGLQTAHLDGDRANCRLSNLAYLTPSENNLQKHEHGTMPRGEAHHRAILTVADVVEIRRRAGERTNRHCRINGHRAIAREYGVSEQQIHKIVARKLWKHVA